MYARCDGCVAQNCEDLTFIAAMTNPGSGRNDIPSRLKRHFLAFSMTAPDLDTIDSIYGQLIQVRCSCTRLHVLSLSVLSSCVSA